MHEAIQYLNSLGLHKIKPGLERTYRLLDVLGNPHNDSKSIIVGGTNGKGSVSATITSVLANQGFRTGLYTSPHLIDVTERIKVNQHEIPLNDICRLILIVRDAARGCLTEDPSYFEVLTVVAFLYFSEKRVDYNVLEVGMGGRFDATNVVTPIVSVITNVSKDHTDYLGNTIREIAFEKAGIIKQNIPVVTGAKGVALKVLNAIAYERCCAMDAMDRDFYFITKDMKYFDYYGDLWKIKDITYSLPGYYHIKNATVALATLETLSNHEGFPMDINSIRKGLSATSWEGRMEIARTHPPLILDGAHNPSGAIALRDSMEKAFPGERFSFLVGMLFGKDHKGFIKGISGIANEIILTEPPTDRSYSAEDLARIARNYIADVKVVKDFRLAFSEINKDTSQPTCITGSLYLIG
ncbi:MAG: bifunctional folylpolyglutamate synthase/dihydrofolate synthase, partial [Thermodesulfobacteriota bacterium]